MTVKEITEFLSQIDHKSMTVARLTALLGDLKDETPAPSAAWLVNLITKEVGQ